MRNYNLAFLECEFPAVLPKNELFELFRIRSESEEAREKIILYNMRIVSYEVNKFCKKNNLENEKSDL